MLLLLPCALLHNRADELSKQSQEVLCVSGVELLEQSEQTQNQRGPVHRISRFLARHSFYAEKSLEQTSLVPIHQAKMMRNETHLDFCCTGV